MAPAQAPKAAVFGARGFVGRRLVQHLGQVGYEVREIVRGDESWRGLELGHVFYAIGLTADFRSRPFETMDAHVSVLADVLRASRFTSFVYCSSTRVYAGAESTDEAAPLRVMPADPDHLYNISKLAGEALCLGSGLKGVRVARLSNVYGEGDTSQNFLTSVLRSALESGVVSLQTALTSAKDYVSVDDVVLALEAIAARGTEPIVNVAFGRNTSHGELMAAIHAATGASVRVAPAAREVTFPEIATEKLDGLVARARTPVTRAIPSLALGLRVQREADVEEDE